jgi:hypothetical protein
MSEVPSHRPTPLPPELQSKLHLLLRSRKFWATVVAVAFIVLGPRAGVDQQALTAAVITIVGYILGTALEDGLNAQDRLQS